MGFNRREFQTITFTPVCVTQSCVKATDLLLTGALLRFVAKRPQKPV
jgi:hypothetical protein